MTDNRYDSEAKLYRDADFISNGACNPVAVCGALHDAMKFVLHSPAGDMPAIKDHPAIRVMLDHLCVIVFGTNHEAGTMDYVKVMNAVKAKEPV
jgi:hypothetical protein